MNFLLLTSFCTCFIGNGFNPIHYFICNDKDAKQGVLCYVVFRFISSLVTGALVYPSVWVTFATYFICFCVAKFTRSFIVNSFVFYFITNTFCFFEMSLMYGYYPYTIDGYFMCMIAGIPFALHGLIACSICYVVEKALTYFKSTEKVAGANV